jgi:hypothetical protein
MVHPNHIQRSLRYASLPRSGVSAGQSPRVFHAKHNGFLKESRFVIEFDHQCLGPMVANSQLLTFWG